MRRIATVLLAIILMLSLSLPITACTGTNRADNLDTSGFGNTDVAGQNAKDIYGDIDIEPGTWAFYWYLCGSNLESDGACATTDLNEMMQAKLPGNVQVVIETGGSKTWNNDLISSDELGRYLYDSGGLSKLGAVPDANMSDPNTLAEFLLYCNKNHPAEKQVVILWDHGGGSVYGLINDERYRGETISLRELGGALSAAPASSGTYEIVGFDACLMATIETADVLNEYARYMVASEESEPGGGWEYSGLFSAFAGAAPQDGAALGKAICDSYYAGCRTDGTDDMATLSVVDLGKVGTLLDAWRNLGDEALLSAVRDRSAFLSSFGNAARQAENYTNSEQIGYSNMVDIGDLLAQGGETLLPSNGKAARAALGDSVLYQIKGAQRSNANGLATYYCYDGDADSCAQYGEVADFPGFEYLYEYTLNGSLTAAGTDYVKQLQSSGGTGTGADTIQPLPPVDSQGLDGTAVTLGSNGHYTLNIGADKAADIAFVSLHVVLYSEYQGEVDWVDDLGTNRAVDASQLARGIYVDTFDGKVAVARNKGTEAFSNPVYLEVTDRKPGQYTLYSTPVLLNDKESELLLKLDEANGAYTILGVRSGMNRADNLASKDLRQLTEGDILIPINRMSSRDFGTGTFPKIDWVDVGLDPAGNYGGFVLTEQAEFYDLAFLSGLYRVSFVMTDYAGKQYESAPGWFRYETDGTLIPAQNPKVPDVGL
jgi:hypothetical protein